MGTRQNMRLYLVKHLFRAAMAPSIAYFAYALLAFCTAYYLWPEIGNPGVNASYYGLSAAQAAEVEATDTSYSQLLEAGTLAYGLGYAAWLGVSAGFYSVAAALCLVVMKNRLAAFVFPSAIYLAQSVLAIALIGPQAGLVYSVHPFGLTQLPIWIAAAPQLLFIFSVIAGAGYVLSNIYRKGYLT
ncbi:MAG TPA: hypothetical protein VGP12_08720 [Nitrosospira sp.]|nr:hypothetical protein [Nitrosospira sp.]